MIPLQVGITIKEALEINKDLKNFYEMNEDVRNLLDYAMSIEGLPSFTSTHAAGVLVCPSNVTNYVPTSVNDGVVVSQFNMEELEELGLSS